MFSALYQLPLMTLKKDLQYKHVWLNDTVGEGEGKLAPRFHASDGYLENALIHTFTIT